MDKKENPLLETIRQWLTPVGLLGLIAALLISYGGFKEYIKTVTFTDAQIKVLSENYIKNNLGVSEKRNLEANNELTRKYNQLTVAIDTLSSIYKKSYESVDAYTKVNQAILNMVHNVDSISKERLEILKGLKKEANIQSNATQLALDKQGDILRQVDVIRALIENPHTNLNGD